MKTQPIPIGVVILTAGLSSRMQTDKAFLLADAEQTFIEKICNTYQDWGCSEIIVVVNNSLQNKIKKLSHIPQQVKIVMNNRLEHGRFYSVQLGLAALTVSTYCFIQNIDNPFIDAPILDLLAGQKSKNDTVVPVFKDRGGHPVLIGSGIIEKVVNHPKQDDNLKDFLYRFQVKRVETTFANVLTNINYPAEYDKFVKNKNG